MAVEYEISSDVATIKDVAPNTQVARVVSLYSGQITYDDEAGSKFATATINGKSQRVMLCIAVNGTVNYDDVPCLYSTVDGHRCLNIVSPTETGAPDDVPSVYETVVIDGKNVRAVRCILINATPVYDGVSSVCTFTGDDGKTHTAQLVNKITGGSVEVIVRGSEYIALPDAVADSLAYLKAFGGTEQRNLPSGYTELEYIESSGTQYIDTGINGGNLITAEIKAVFQYGDSTKLFGYRTSTTTTRNVILASAGYYLDYGYGSQVTSGVNVDSNIHIFKLDKNKAYIDGVLTNTYTEQTFTGGSMYLFACNQNGEVNGATRAKVYYAKILNNGTIVRNLIPAKRESDNVIGMYDTVSHTFFTNAGTGDFLDGPVVSAPTPTHPIDLVCNNGVVKVNTETSGKNAIDTSDTEQGYLNSTVGQVPGILTSSASMVIKNAIKVSNGKKYKFSYYSNISGNRESDIVNNNGIVTLRQTLNCSTGLNEYTIEANADGYLWVTVQLGDFATVKPTVYEIGGIYADGTVETISVHGKNLFDITALTRNAGYMVSTTNGAFNSSDQYTRSDYIPVLPNTQYIRTISGAASTIFFGSNKNFLSSQTRTSFTTPADCYYVMYNVKNNVDYSQGMMVKGDELPTTYEPYFNGGTAIAEMLLKVGDYEDTQEILSGTITRNVGVKVLDGTEGWVRNETNIYCFGSADIRAFENPVAPISTHFTAVALENVSMPDNSIKLHKSSFFPSQGVVFIKDTAVGNVTNFKQYLADQYAAGTPVIIVYPLKTPTTESVAGQTMRVQQGDNIVEITQAAIDGLEIEAKYQAAVSLTIQEVQDANLDPNVQVTIN